jgi:hypothetical protein
VRKETEKHNNTSKQRKGRIYFGEKKNKIKKKTEKGRMQADSRGGKEPGHRTSHRTCKDDEIPCWLCWEERDERDIRKNDGILVSEFLFRNARSWTMEKRRTNGSIAQTR